MKHILIFFNILFYFMSTLLLATELTDSQLSTVNGYITNGQGTSENIEGIKVRLYINSVKVSETTADPDGHYNFSLSSSVIASGGSPNNFSLEQNYPNPFQGRTQIPYQINNNGPVALTIYDILGHKVKSLVNESKSMGSYIPFWDGRSDSGLQCATGMYIYVLQQADKTVQRKMMLTNSSTLHSSPLLASPMLSKSISTNDIEIRFKSRSITDTTLSFQIDENQTSLNVETCALKFYPFVRESENTYSLMSGESISDTLNIYYEDRLSVSCDNIPMSYELLRDSLLILHYNHVDEEKSLLTISDNRTGKLLYAKTYFTLSPRLEIFPKILRRAYIGIPYSNKISFEGVQGDVDFTLISIIPDEFSQCERTVSGLPSQMMDQYIYFKLTDDRQITVTDSIRLIVGNKDDIDFNDYVLDMIEYYQRDGRYAYNWSSGYGGVTQDLYYKGTRILKESPDGSGITYCCGITFEAFFRSMSFLHEDLDRNETIGSMTASDMQHFQQLWFVTSDPHRGPDLAMETYNIGESIDDFSNVRSGDFLQIWRTGGTGHSVIFLDWTTNTAGDTTGIRYWSTQPSTDGINYNIEYFPAYGGTLDIDNLYFGRVTVY